MPHGGGNPTKTRMARTANSDGSFLSVEDEYCCLGFASVSLALLDSFQRIPGGTVAGVSVLVG